MNKFAPEAITAVTRFGERLTRDNLVSGAGALSLPQLMVPMSVLTPFIVTTFSGEGEVLTSLSFIFINILVRFLFLNRILGLEFSSSSSNSFLAFLEISL